MIIIVGIDNKSRSQQDSLHVLLFITLKCIYLKYTACYCIILCKYIHIYVLVYTNTVITVLQVVLLFLKADVRVLLVLTHIKFYYFFRSFFYFSSTWITFGYF